MQKEREAASSCYLIVAIEKTSLGIAAGGLCVLVILNALNVIGRSLLPSPFTWVDECMSFVMVVSVFSGALAATRKGCHISVDIFYQLMPLMLRKVVRVAGAVVSVATLATLGVASTKIVDILRQFDQRSDAMEFPVWIVQSVVPIFLFISAALIIYLAFQTVDEPEKVKGE